jgi:hypothetical protein
MKTCAMKVVSLLGTTHEYPSDGLVDVESPVFQRLKQLIELEFYTHFDRKLNITNWDYILKRAEAYRIK